MTDVPKHTIKDLMAGDAYIWAEEGGLTLSSGPFSTLNHQWQIELLQDDSPKQCARKATQGGWSDGYVIKLMHHLIHGIYPQGAWYMLPTQDDVSDFSDSRFRPLIRDNMGLIGKYIRDTNRTNLKRIGRANLYFRGARMSQKTDANEKSIHKIKTFSSDCCVFDEVDEMDQLAITAGLERMAHSTLKHEWYLGNPTIPNYGIDLLYQESDQRVWMVRCDYCNHWQCLDLEFPDCLMKQKDGGVIRGCMKCRREINPDKGQWVARYPSRSEEFVGRWLGHPSSPMVNPKDLLKKWSSPFLNKKTFYNLSLGLAYILAENQLTLSQVFECCGMDPMEEAHQGPAAMGIDVQGERKGFHILIGVKPTESTKKIVKMVRLSQLNDMYDLIKKFHVSTAVVDIEPETRLMKEFQKHAGQIGCEVFLCDYKETQRTNPAFDSKKGMVTINRTEICDTTHETVAEEDILTLPRKCEEVEVFAKHMNNEVKILDEDDETGNKEYHYRKISQGVQDDYYHAFNYLNLAFMRVSVSRQEAKKVKPKDGWAGAWDGDHGEKSVGYMGM